MSCRQAVYKWKNWQRTLVQMKNLFSTVHKSSKKNQFCWFASASVPSHSKANLLPFQVSAHYDVDFIFLLFMIEAVFLAVPFMWHCSPGARRSFALIAFRDYCKRRCFGLQAWLYLQKNKCLPGLQKLQRQKGYRFSPQLLYCTDRGKRQKEKGNSCCNGPCLFIAPAVPA